MKSYSFILVILLLIGIPANSQIEVSSLFSDNMVLQQQAEVPVWGWAEKGEEIQLKTSWDSRTTTAKADAEGRWNANIQTPKAGGPYEITISQEEEELQLENIMAGEVWLCSGQSNMEMPLKGFPGQPVEGGNETIVRSANKNLRFITIPRNAGVKPEKNFEGQWEISSPQTTGDFSATAWYFGSLIEEALDVPVGLIHVSYGGSSVEAWMNKEMLKDFEDISIPESENDLDPPMRTATALFNGMLSPVIGYGIKGSIWYQGESNYDRPFQYQELFSTMVKEWRELWGQGNFPFYYAQIAPFNYAQFTPDEIKEKNNSAYVRESQLNAQEDISNSGMIVLMDTGKKNNIHPPEKRKAGERLAFRALAETYGIEGFEFRSPEFKDLEIKGSNVVVAFDYAPNGITSYEKPVEGFEIAGEDQIFHPATAKVRRKSVILSSPEVEKPVAVRYLFGDYVEAELFSTGGLPVSSFRTDDWNPEK